MLCKKDAKGANEVPRRIFTKNLYLMSLAI
jgi:hypothetical protein